MKVAPQTRPKAAAPIKPRTSQRKYSPPKKIVESNTERVLRLYPPKAVGLPAEDMSSVQTVTPSLKKILLRDNHYENGGIYADFKDKMAYFGAAEIKQYEITTDHQGNILGTHALDSQVVVEEVTKPFAPLKGIRKYLIDKKVASKTQIETSSLDELRENYNIPDDILYTQ